MPNNLRTAVLLGLLTALLIWLGGYLGGPRGLLFALPAVAAMNFGSLFFSDKIVLRMYRATEISPEDSPELHAVVRELAAAAAIPMPRLYLIPSDAPNAFATGRSPAHAAVAVTEGIVRSLTRDELRGVLAHELSHVKNRDTLIGAIAATLAGVIMMVARMAQYAAIFGGIRRDEHEERGGGLELLVMLIVAPLAAMLVQMAVSRSREYEADATGARLSRAPRALAAALEKIADGSGRVPLEAGPATAHLFIVSPLHGRGFSSLFSTHPPVEERIRRLRAMAY